MKTNKQSKTSKQSTLNKLLKNRLSNIFNLLFISESLSQIIFINNENLNKRTKTHEINNRRTKINFQLINDLIYYIQKFY